jgi:CRP-like cAMP-binding protein
MADAGGIKESRITDSIIDFLIDIPLFDELKSNELKVVARQMNHIELQRNDFLFKEGDKGSYMCFVVEGILDVIKQTASHSEVTISSLTRGRSIGEMSVIDNFPRSASVKARTAASLLVLTQRAFDDLLEKQPQIGIKILKALGRLLSMNLRKTSSQLADFMLTAK